MITKHFSTLILSVVLTLPICASAQVDRPVGNDQWYYKLGGGESFIYYRQSKRTNVELGVGADWRMFRGCEFDPRVSISDTFKNAQLSIYGLADNLVDSAKGMVTAWGLSKIQESYPTLYDFILNGAKDATQKFQLAMKSCRDYQADLNAKRDPTAGWVAFGKSSSWANAANDGANPVAVEQNIDRTTAERGVTWIGGELRGGRDSDPIKIIQDSTKVGYEHLSDEGAGSTAEGNALGVGMDNDSMVFKTVEEAQIWTQEVLGERIITTCTDCDKLEVQVGQGLRLKLVEERDTIIVLLRQVIVAPTNPSLDELNELSVPSLGLVVTDTMIRRLRSLETYEINVFASKLAGEIAMMKVMEKALTARDIIKVGMQEPNVAANNQATQELEAAKARLDSEINDMLFESDIRKKIFSQTAVALTNLADSKEGSKAVNAMKGVPADFGRLKGGAISHD